MLGSLCSIFFKVLLPSTLSIGEMGNMRNILVREPHILQKYLVFNHDFNGVVLLNG